MAGGTPRRSLSLYPCFLKDFLRAVARESRYFRIPCTSSRPT
jgi:hypothetical protein